MGGGGPKNVTSTTNTEPPQYLSRGLQNLVNSSSREFNQSGDGPGANLIGQGQSLIGQTLNGDFLNSNPYLDQTFNRAADQTRTRLSSEFSGNGRDLDASGPARSDELQTLASNIYGGNYQAERDRMGQALAQGQGYDPTNRYANQLASVMPGAGGVTSSTQPVFKTGLI